MYAKDLIGRWAIRTAPTCDGDKSYMRTPVKIISVMCFRIKIEHDSDMGVYVHHALPASFDDNYWQSAYVGDLIKIQIGTCKCFNVSRQVAAAICKLLEAI